MIIIILGQDFFNQIATPQPFIYPFDLTAPGGPILELTNLKNFQNGCAWNQTRSLLKKSIQKLAPLKKVQAWKCWESNPQSHF